MLVEDVEDEDKDDENEDKDDEDEDDEDEDNTCGGAKECLCYKLADDHPEHNWIVTKKGYELMKEWLIQADKRCPDNFDMYIFNDFYGYGICEVIENMVILPIHVLCFKRYYLLIMHSFWLLPRSRTRIPGIL